MMNWLKKLWHSPMLALKIAGAVIIVLIILSIALRLISDVFTSMGFRSGLDFVTSPSVMRNMAYDEDMSEGAMMKVGMGGAQSMIAPMPPQDGGFTTGDDAEDFEVTEYNVNIKTRNKENECAQVASLKDREDVIFESANEYDKGCNYSFKVEHARAAEILAMIEGLHPDTLNENTYTIKRGVDYVSNELEILQQKLQSITETMENSIAAYDEITRIATSTRDAESLATIIDSKVRLIERLTQEKININEQIDRLQRNMSDQLERLDYTYFHISVQEDKFVDFKDIKDSWKQTIKSFIRDTNRIAQAITVGVIGLIFVIIQYVLYFFILLFVAKYGWKYAKRVWMK